MPSETKSKLLNVTLKNRNPAASPRLPLTSAYSNSLEGPVNGPNDVAIARKITCDLRGSGIKGNKKNPGQLSLVGVLSSRSDAFPKRRSAWSKLAVPIALLI